MVLSNYETMVVCAQNPHLHELQVCRLARQLILSSLLAHELEPVFSCDVMSKPSRQNGKVHNAAHWRVVIKHDSPTVIWSVLDATVLSGKTLGNDRAADAQVVP